MTNRQKPLKNVYTRIIKFNKDRLPDMLVYKYKEMSLNAFSFFRGTCHLFYEDLHAADSLLPSPTAWICGDLHLENFGCFKGDNHQEYFDLNDFDEALLAPVSWELARIVTSIFVAFDNLSLKASEARKTAEMFLEIYSSTLSKGKAISVDHRTADGIVGEFLTTVEKRKQRDLIKKRTVNDHGKLVLLTDNKRHFKLGDPDLKKELIHFIEDWIKKGHLKDHKFKILDCIFRLAGTGSIGLKRYMFLLRSTVKDRYLLLDIKQAAASSLRPYVSTNQPQWESEAERVVAVKQRMQNVSPAFLSTGFFKGEAYLIQLMQPTEDKIEFELLKGRHKEIACVIDDMAVLTASAQLRSSGRQGSSVADELIAFGQNNQWQESILNYALHYAKQVKSDYNEFKTEYKKKQTKQPATAS